MTRHHCPGDQCPHTAERIDAYEAGPLASDVEAATRRAEGEFERLVYREPRRQPAPADRDSGQHMTRRQADEWERQKLRRMIREFNQQGRTA